MYSGEITLPRFLLAQLLSDAAEMGANKALSKTGVIKPWLSKAEAYRMYGERIVKRWDDEGKIKAERMSPSSNKLFYPRTALEALDKSSSPVLSLITTTSH